MPVGVYKRSKAQLEKLKEMSLMPRPLRNGGYDAIHKWLYKHYGKANKCENPFCDQSSHKFQWAKKKNHEYKHDVDNFIQLCCKCHRKYDDTKERGIKAGKTRLGKKLTLEQRQKISKNCKGMHSGNKHSAKRIIQTDLSGNVIKVWNSIKDAAIELKVSSSGITMCAKGQLKTSGGFKWNYLSK